MVTKQLTLNSTTFESFHVRRDSFPRHHNIWHYHEELEFIYIKKGAGTLFVGDRIKDFNSGDIVLIGSNIPHYWLFDRTYLDTEQQHIDCIVTHFKKDFGSNLFFNTPELTGIKELIQRADKGLWADLSTTCALHAIFEYLTTATGTGRIIYLLQALDDYRTLPLEKLVSENYTILNHSTDEKRMNDIMSYIREYYKTKIELSDLANQARMTKNSLCRYFKQKTGKSILRVVMELRISNACRLLNSSPMSLKEICFEIGFNNTVSFHKAFKETMGITPAQYKKLI